MFSFRKLAVAGSASASASIPLLGLLFGIIIGLLWLSAVSLIQIGF